jgi:hypothetical protein
MPSERNKKQVRKSFGQTNGNSSVAVAAASTKQQWQQSFVFPMHIQHIQSSKLLMYCAKALRVERLGSVFARTHAWVHCSEAGAHQYRAQTTYLQYMCLSTLAAHQCTVLLHSATLTPLCIMGRARSSLRSSNRTWKNPCPSALELVHSQAFTMASKIVLMTLPYAKNALAPHISEEVH